MFRQITELLFYSSKQRTWKFTGRFLNIFWWRKCCRLRPKDVCSDLQCLWSTQSNNGIHAARKRQTFKVVVGSECRCDICGVWRSQHLRGWAFNTRTPLSIERGWNRLVRDEVSTPRLWGRKGRNISEQYGKFQTIVQTHMHTRLANLTPFKFVIHLAKT